jgi:hypothetical protein
MFDLPVMSGVSDWAGVAAAIIGPFIGVLGALLLYEKSRRDQARADVAERVHQFRTQLSSEKAANAKTIERSISTIDEVLERWGTEQHEPNDPIPDGRLYIAPLFDRSFRALLDPSVQKDSSERRAGGSVPVLRELGTGELAHRSGARFQIPRRHPPRDPTDAGGDRPSVELHLWPSIWASGRRGSGSLSHRRAERPCPR